MSQGKFLFPDGSMYEGDVAKGLRHGQGVLYNPTLHCLYEGTWDTGTRHGQGTLFYDENKKQFYKGMWQRGKRHGTGHMTYASGNTYDGEWVADKKRGKGTVRQVHSLIFALCVGPNHRVSGHAFFFDFP